MNPFPINVVVATDGPSVWDILTAFGTVLAVLAAVFLGLREQHASSKQIAKLEQERDAAVRETAKREREAQVREIAVWTVQRPHGVKSMGDGHETWDGFTTELHIQNFSRLPLFDLVPGFRHDADITAFSHMHPGLPPGGIATCDLPKTTVVGPIDDFTTGWIFRDLSNAIWFRDVMGVYTELPREDSSQE